MSMKQMEVSIMGQSYVLACPDGGDAVLAEAVTRVDREMCAIRDAGRVKARERIAVLTALNLAYQQAERAAAPAPAPAPAASGEDSPSSQDLEPLIRRIDAALGDDGHLL